VPVGELDPEHVVTPCLYVDRVVRVDRNLAVSGGRS
jgi:acyl CoA:acetate/3-ketoacid CoA transferase alpha subunit